MTIEFAALLKPLIEQSGINYSDLAARIGAAGGYISHVLSGELSPGPLKARLLMDVLNVPPELQARFLLEAAGYPEDVIREA